MVNILSEKSPLIRSAKVHVLFSENLLSMLVFQGSSPHLRTSPMGPTVGTNVYHRSALILSFHPALLGEASSEERPPPVYWRLTFVPADNESEKQVNSFCRFLPPERPGQTRGAGGSQLITVGGGSERSDVLWKEETTNAILPVPPPLPPPPPPLSRGLEWWHRWKWENYIKPSSGVALSRRGFSVSKHSEVSRQDRARLGRWKSAAEGAPRSELSYLFTA